jgi:hypothetical protein
MTLQPANKVYNESAAANIIHNTRATKQITNNIILYKRYQSKINQKIMCLFYNSTSFVVPITGSG